MIRERKGVGSIPTLKSGFDLVRVQEPAEGYWCPLVEEDAHSGDLGRGQAFGCMVENRTHLLDRDAREPFHKLGDFHPIFKVFKEG
jgi:hypothetical protein